MFKNLFPHKISVVMVCKANICRSPMAEGMTRQRLQAMGLKRRFRIDSAGTQALHEGHRPDLRVQKLMGAAGISLAGIRSRLITVNDIIRNDYVLVMDRANYHDVVAMCPPEHKSKIKLLMSYASELEVADVPDPYFGTVAGFDEVFRLLDDAVSGLIAQIVEEIPV